MTVHPPLAVPLRKHMRVLDPVGVEGVIVGFKSTITWSFRRPTRVSWVVVEQDGVRSFRAPSALRVVEKSTVAERAAQPEGIHHA